MKVMSHIIALTFLGFVLSLPVWGADDKPNKTDPPKNDVKKNDVKKDEPAKKEESAKKDEPAKKAAGKTETKKSAGMRKLPPRGGKYKNLEDDPDAATKKMLKAPKVQGEVVAIVEDKKSLRLRLTIPYVKINPGQVQNYIKAQNSMLRATNPQGIMNAQNSMARAAAQIYQIATTTKEVEWTSTDEVKVRMRNPPPQFDDKGRARRPTAKELRELKGNDKLPFYPAEFSDLKSGQVVQVTLQQKKGPRPVRRGKDAERAAAGDDLPKMMLIIILAEPRN